VMDAGVEIGVVADAAWHAELDVALADEMLAQRLVTPATQLARQRRAQRTPIVRRLRHQRIHVVALHESCRLQIDDLVADRNADAKARIARATKAPEREILDR